MKRALVLALLLTAAAAATAATPASTGASCPADSDLSGLVWALADLSGRLAGGATSDPCAVNAPGGTTDAPDDLRAVCVAAAALRARADERAGLCRQVAGLKAQIAVLKESASLSDAMLAGCRTDRESCWTDWTARLKAPVVTPGRGAFGWTVGGGACLDSDGALSVCAAAVWGIRF